MFFVSKEKSEIVYCIKFWNSFLSNFYFHVMDTLIEHRIGIMKNIPQLELAHCFLMSSFRLCTID